MLSLQSYLVRVLFKFNNIIWKITCFSNLIKVQDESTTKIMLASEINTHYIFKYKKT